jgi:hypothetical protein
MAHEASEWLPGNVSGAWRVGDTVRRVTGPWTPAVHALLEYLRPRLPGIPQVLGFDDQGREVLTYLPGRVVDIDREMLTSAQLRSGVAWTRRFHEAAAGFDHPGPWRLHRPEHPTLDAHNDIAPYNMCFDGDDLVGVFDWDMSAPSTALLELAFIAWNCVPLWRDIGVREAAERLELISSTYRTYSAPEILAAVVPRIQMMLDWIPRAAAAGDEGMLNLQAAGEPERSRRSLDDLVGRLPAIAELLA